MWGGGLNYFFGDILGLNFVQEEKKKCFDDFIECFFTPSFPVATHED